MAYAITDKPNTSAPDADYPYGNIKDKTISVAGTPINKLVYADFHQFFARLMAEGNVTPNGLPDNGTNGFQLYEALKSFTGGLLTTCIDIGAWDMDATATVNVAHGLIAITSVVSMKAIIRRDSLLEVHNLDEAGNIYIDPTNVVLERTGGALFDNAAYSSLANRGFIIIQVKA